MLFKKFAVTGMAALSSLVATPAVLAADTFSGALTGGTTSANLQSRCEDGRTAAAGAIVATEKSPLALARQDQFLWDLIDGEEQPGVVGQLDTKACYLKVATQVSGEENLWAVVKAGACIAHKQTGTGSVYCHCCLA